MKFYVIYSFDILADMSVKALQPINVKAWELTETDDSYDYLGPEYENGKHRKYCRLMSKEAFVRFIEDQCLYMNDIDTLGSLTEYGHLPAFSFDSEPDERWIINQNAYVTPLPDIKSNKVMNEKNWKLLKKALLNLFGPSENNHWDQTYRNLHFQRLKRIVTFNKKKYIRVEWDQVIHENAIMRDDYASPLRELPFYMRFAKGELRSKWNEKFFFYNPIDE
jgi:hypothetical protein